MTFQSNGPVANENYSIATGANSTGPFITALMTRDPTSFDAQYPVKQRWINTSSGNEWILTGFSNVTGQTLANWLLLAGGFIKSTWIPIVDGSTPGTTVYNPAFRIGSYVQLDGLIQTEFTVVVISATGTGDLRISGLPVSINSQTNGNVIGSVILVDAITWPLNTTSIALLGTPGSSFLTIWCSGPGIAGSNLQMQNTTMNIQGTIVYEI